MKHRKSHTISGLILLSVLSMAGAAQAQQLTGTENGEWRYLGGDIGHTRYTPNDQINAGNFGDLEQAWIWRSDNFGPNVDYFLAFHPDLRRWHRLYRGHAPAPGSGHRSGHRRNPVDFS